MISRAQNNRFSTNITCTDGSGFCYIFSKNYKIQFNSSFYISKNSVYYMVNTDDAL